jgi:hypothetical protein
MSLVSPAGDEIFARRRTDGSYAAGIVSAGFRSTATITRPSNATAYTAGDVVGDTGGSAIISLTSAGPSGGFVLVQSVSLVFSDSTVPSWYGCIPHSHVQRQPDGHCR